MARTKKNHTSSGTAALQELDSASIEYTVFTYNHDADHMDQGFGLEGAAQLDVPADSIFKTLLVDIGEKPGQNMVTVIVPVTCHVNLKAVAATFHAKKAHMAEPSIAQRQTGYVVGGISPFGHKTQHDTVLDESAQLYDMILVSGGKRGLSVGVKPIDLITLLNAKIASVASEGSHPR
ncbi:Cys-tRNA(Pro) deacylase [Alloscardovia omnicolens]|uniref:Cys-tRNA(Pro) deacylase n=1 Tax=Alloscardovia omnicolens TaxID=419015 RepID=UPI003A799CA1